MLRRSPCSSTQAGWADIRKTSGGDSSGSARTIRESGSRAYPLIDVPVLPTPLPFRSGYLVQGTATNLFPDQEVRIASQTAYEK